MLFSPEDNQTSSSNLSTPSYELDRSLRFWFFFIPDVIAVLCNVFTLYHLLMKKNLRQALHNHALILMLLFGLVYQLIDIPLHLQFFKTGVVRPATPGLCPIWWFIDWGFYYTIQILLLFTSIERHILIFHSLMLATRRKRLFFHYLPMILIVLFMMTFYSVAIFAPICVNTFDYTSDLCGLYACYESLPFFVTVEQIGFSTVPSCLIAVFNITLFVRVVRQKHRVCRSIQWRKQRKLATQVILMSLLFLVFGVPVSIIYLVRFFGQPNWAMKVFPLFFFLSYFPIFGLSFVCLTSLPKLWEKVKKLNPRPQRRIAAIGIL